MPTEPTDPEDERYAGLRLVEDDRVPPGGAIIIADAGAENREDFLARKLAEITRDAEAVEIDPELGEFQYPKIVAGDKPKQCPVCDSTEPHAPHAIQKLAHIYAARLNAASRPQTDGELFPTLEEIDAAIRDELPELNDVNLLSPGDVLLFRHSEHILDAKTAGQVEARLRQRIGPDIPVLVFGSEWEARILRPEALAPAWNDGNGPEETRGMAYVSHERVGMTGEPMTAVECEIGEENTLER